MTSAAEDAASADGERPASDAAFYVRPASHVVEQAPLPPPAARPDGEPALEEIAPGVPLAGPHRASAGPLTLDEVAASVVAAYPLLRASYEAQRVADGEQLSAAGEFDLKIKAESHNKPLYFYENYRHAVGLEQPLYHGGSLFAGYRIGRGEFEPWYLERETNDGGEFKLGITTPLAQNRTIDARRAELWRREWASRAVDPMIRADVLRYVFEASQTYWLWVAAGRNVVIAEELLDLARDRQAGLERQFQEGNIAQIDLVDNQRLIVSREVKVIESRQKLQESAVKLSLFLRGPLGEPTLPDVHALPNDFPPVPPCREDTLQADVTQALQSRPELAQLEFNQRELEVDLLQARNLSRPEIDGYLMAAQDVGAPTSPKRDKSPLELEAGLVGSLPLQRRKAVGKIAALEGKLAQLSAKREFTANKIVADVQTVHVALAAIRERLEKASESMELAVRMREAERRKLETGESDLLLLNFREQQAADAATLQAQILLEYYLAEAAYRAAMAIDPLKH